jgi:hypothetical protein
MKAILEQPLPNTDNDLPHADVMQEIIDDLIARRELGAIRYGQPLRTFNGRDALVDLQQELLDALVYSGQVMREKDWLKGVLTTILDCLEGRKFMSEAEVVKVREMIKILLQSSAVNNLG